MVKSTIAGLLGRSPFRPIQQHMELVMQCAAEVLPLMRAVQAGDAAAVEAARVRIFELENQADDAKNEIRSNLPKSLLMPVDRRDLLEILHAQDTIADRSQDVAGLLAMRQIAVPPSFENLLLEYVEKVLDAVRKCHEIIHELDELLEMGFRGRQVDRVTEMIDELSDIESATDSQGMELAARLFRLDEELPTGTFILWHELIQKIGGIADIAENVADRLRLLMAR